MSEPTHPDQQPRTPTPRPGGRSARVRTNVVAATLAEVTEKGYDGLTAEAVAARSGVHKATLYRRWGGIDGLVADALTASADQPWPLPDTGDLQEDLRRITQEVFDVFTDPERSPTPIALISAAQRSDVGAAALRDFFAARHHQAAEVAERAVARGELPVGTDGAEVVSAATAPLYYRLFVTGEPLDARTAERAADAATLAARAGLFMTTSTTPTDPEPGTTPATPTP
ncbi:TetR/AcrR family transcriptional regulator [Kitasatospora cathayae]|uniref:TetR/AcrR family transcriptional regulator n=1 Tax=Kitasatospora cathayae TaxID=3004092 RepID=A0ABY7Q5G8_9ACTN|nr:TetR/AcrR family transcriptional regulator [Kitasatospora sp. HUAS 3-15]WBP87399.1 TetR/AcrR family transcriptional regulator [Kitasatospora sp. HUAS 3-15]